MDYVIPADCQVKDLNKIYLDYFGYKTDGFFVDVGANDGITASNIYGLALAGWEGLCYEAVPDYYRRCVENFKEYPKVKCINTVVGDRKGYVEFTVAGMISTYNDYHIHTEYWGPDYAWGKKIGLPIITLDESLKESEVIPEFDVFSLDVEGSETDVLQHFDIGYWLPKMAIIEAQELHLAYELRNQARFINEYFNNFGYKKIYCDEINNIYVR